MRKLFFITLLFIFGLGFTNRAVFGWDDVTTHPGLTNNTVDFYNLNFDKKISVQEKEWLIQGSVEEDTPPRWINHFYDPIYKEGWTGEHGPTGVSEDLVQKFSDVFLSPESAVSAINWAHNQELQAKYKLYKGNKTWEKALYEYVNGNEKEAFLSLGHVLHLLQDMSVPEHTRNDTHPGDSPIENFCRQFTRDKFYIVDELKNEQPEIFNNLDDYFESLATYSNNYFFNKDTINDPKYEKPIIAREDFFWTYGKDKNETEFMLSGVDYKKLNEYETVKIYAIKEVEEYITLSSTPTGPTGTASHALPSSQAVVRFGSFLKKPNGLRKILNY